MNTSHQRVSSLARSVKNQHKELSDIARQLIDYIRQLQNANTQASEAATNAAADKENECKTKFDEIAAILGETPTTQEVDSVITEARTLISPDAPDAETMVRSGGYKYRKLNTKKRKQLQSRKKTSKTSSRKNKHERH